MLILLLSDNYIIYEFYNNYLPLTYLYARIIQEKDVESKVTFDWLESRDSRFYGNGMFGCCFVKIINASFFFKLPIDINRPVYSMSTACDSKRKMQSSGYVASRRIAKLMQNPFALTFSLRLTSILLQIYY